MRPISCTVFLAIAVSGCSRYHAIHGSVINRNGEPLERVIVSLEPGDVELVTDEQGNFTIDYLRDESGERVKLQKKIDYTLTAFKPGYHDASSSFYFKRGELDLESMTMVEDTIRVDAGEENIDPDLYPDRTQNHGAAYEGE